jgi:hypothetical protein
VLQRDAVHVKTSEKLMLDETRSSTRREFARNGLQSLVAMALIEGLWSSRLFGAGVAPLLDPWFKEINEISKDVHDHKTKDVEFQKSLEVLYQRVDLQALLESLDFDRLAAGMEFPAKGAKSLSGDELRIEGLPQKPIFGRQVFAMKKGRSVVPHGHDNMATGFLVLKGTFRGRHYDRVEDHPDHYLILPTIDRTFKPGEFSTISDHKDNVHWFTAESDTGFIFNVHVVETDPENTKKPGRIYVDPMGEKVAGGLIKAPKITYGKVNQLYG